MRLQLVVAATVSALVVSFIPDVGRPVVGATASHNAYFDALVARSDHWKSYSLRDPSQLQKPSQGGYVYADYLPNPWSYDSVVDAAKATIPEFFDSPSTTLANSLGSGDTVMTLASAPGEFVTGVHVKIDNEVVLITSFDGPVYGIKRAERGTAATSHTAGAGIKIGVNSIVNQLRVPLGTSDGNTYFFVWDSLWTPSYLQANSGLDHYKSWQFESGNTIWFESRVRFNGGWGTSACPFNASTDIACLDFRGYNITGGPSTWSLATADYFGPIVTNHQPIEPLTGVFTVKPNRWTRHFVLIEQRANDYDYISAWAADENVGPVQLLNRVPASVRTAITPNTITKFYWELDTSQDSISTRAVGSQLVSYHRNFVALRNPGDPTPLLIRPLAGTVPPPAPAPLPVPGNLRIIKTPF